MKRSSTLLVIALSLGVLGFGTWWGLKSRPSQATAKPAASVSATAPPPAVVSVLDVLPGDLLVVAPGDMSRQVPVTGTLRPVQQTMLKARVAGELKTLDVREGQSVARGQRIGQIDTLELDSRVKEREAQLQAAEAQLASAQRTQENNRQLLARNFISQAAFDASRFAYEAALGNRDAVRAQLAIARKSLGDATLVAPISGVIAERFAQPGEKLSPDNRIVSIMDLSVMEIEASVPAAELGGVKIGQTVSLKVEGVNQPQTGQVVRIAPSTSSGTRSVPVFIRLQPKLSGAPAKGLSASTDASLLRAGLFAQGQLDVERLGNVLALPQGALREQAGRTTIYIVKDQRIEEREVKTGLHGNQPDGKAVVQVTQGLSAGETVLAVNLGTLRAGAQIKVKQ